MMIRLKFGLVLTLGALVAAGCGDDDVTLDSGTGDSGPDVGGGDGGFDAGRDGGMDAGDGGMDAGEDGGMDAGEDAGEDTGMCTPTSERTWFECTDGIDNDCDGDIDTDVGCSVCPPAAAAEFGAEDDAAQCADGIDNDCDGSVDCESTSCLGIGDCAIEDTAALCSDGIDNDGNGRIDCLQRSCAATSACMPAVMGTEDDAALCGNGLDDDYDGFTDCDDSDCEGLGFCADETTMALCMDGNDNDGDGFVDCNDSGCAEFAACMGEDTDATCTDGLDNDNDGRFDCRDADCTGLAVCRLTETVCDDTLDGDMDGAADCLDADCAGACAALDCSPTNFFGMCEGTLECAGGVCARSLGSYTFPGDMPLLITELMPNPATIDDNDGEYAEVTNVSADPINVQGLGLVDDGAGHTPVTVDGPRVLLPGGTLMFVSNIDPLENGGIVDGIELNDNFGNGSGGDSATLLYMGMEIHHVTYPGTGNDLTNAGSAQSSGQAFNLDQAYIDGTVATASWCLVPEDDANLYDGVGGSNYGTPGAANLVCAVPVD